MVNPFDLAGPEFLAFYVVVGLAGLVWLVYARRRDERAHGYQRIDLSDPYLIAYLRGGTNEAGRVACVSLIDRGLLTVADDDSLRAKPGVSGLQPPIEQEIVDLFQSSKPATDLFNNPAIRQVCEPYDGHLKRLGLLADPATIAARRRRLIPVLAIMLALAVTKAYVGLSRHRPIAFLVILAVGFTVLTLKVYNPRQTGSGDALLGDLRRLFARLKARAGTLRPGASPSETAMLVAVFGVGALPKEKFRWARQLFPKASRGWSTSNSCGSGCGSGCGGGGCGGCGGGGGD